ncbi:hypothetical protein RO3G_00143 [Rhizopus delemar RA 99-880]|uniref:Uncharacterized protein n=1 Tax=Rhizopus delemar (strain RA 99-880 / ATCC MYA-4621 / FGSC 9543 / NRRL 43880) TaxID=246409 RepID=I1BGV5_RHIO9|nr:hypothetical protein RO3G_00139 [Rhizopus delemar RA 99-880]EIE75439.1 hypothetical protein RO3G_00143 [Rhizopus delemar RA 99-880]|eukprot:EIE75435.1 hypothetical protein RO3G_00139 [Rhizopus delemar RA 99-880]
MGSNFEVRNSLSVMWSKSMAPGSSTVSMSLKLG